MLKFRFAGSLRRHYRQITMNVDTPAQGLRLLMAQDQAFKRAMLTTPLRIRVAHEDVTSDNTKFQLDRHLNDGATVLVVPTVQGGGIETGLLIAALVVSALSVGYSLYQARNMKNMNSAEAAQAKTIDNNSFTSAENRVGQGHAVPLLLGEMLVGSNVISLGIDTSNNPKDEELIS